MPHRASKTVPGGRRQSKVASISEPQVSSRYENRGLVEANLPIVSGLQVRRIRYPLEAIEETAFDSFKGTVTLIGNLQAKGRIPGSVWIEWYRMMRPTPTGQMFKSRAAILAECATVGITPDTPVIVFCFKGGLRTRLSRLKRRAGPARATGSTAGRYRNDSPSGRA